MEKIKELCSFIIPCYNEEEAIPIYYDEMVKMLKNMPGNLCFEFIFVDDGSSDRTLGVIRELHQRDDRVRYISFSRNFGKEAGIYSGLMKAKGTFVVVMDVDLQDPPDLIPQMYEAVVKEGYDCVATRRCSREGEPKLRSFFAKQFYKLMNSISKTGIVDGARDFRFMKRQVVDAILQMKEYNRFSKGIFEWVGFHTKYIAYENRERSAGNTKWSFLKLFAYSIEGIIAFSTTPLALASVGGIVLCGISFLLILLLIIRFILFGDPVAGWPSLACIVIFLGGLQLCATGIIGMYLSKTYLECKGRPVFIVKEEV